MADRSRPLLYPQSGSALFLSLSAALCLCRCGHVVGLAKRQSALFRPPCPGLGWLGDKPSPFQHDFSPVRITKAVIHRLLYWKYIRPPSVCTAYTLCVVFLNTSARDLPFILDDLVFSTILESHGCLYAKAQLLVPSRPKILLTALARVEAMRLDFYWMFRFSAFLYCYRKTTQSP